MTIVEKIKALLAMAASTDHQAEAEAFLAKAHALMEKHQLEAGDLETEDPIHESVGCRANGGASPDWDFQLMFAVSRFFGCKSIQWHSKKRTDGTYTVAGEYTMRVVGRESARITAIEMHKYLVKTVRRLGRENAASMGLKADTASRRIGRALHLRIEALTPDEPEAITPAGKNALITLNAVLAKYNELFPDARTLGGAGVLTTDKSVQLAEGIGLNLQVNTARTLALK